MADPLADIDDLTAVMPQPLTDAQAQRAPALLERASALLRGKAPWIDRKITDGSLDPLVVGTVVAGMVARKLLNPSGAISVTTGPYSAAFQSYRTNGVGNDGALRVTADDLAALGGPSRSGLGMMKLRPALAQPCGYPLDRASDAEPCE